MSNLTVEVLIRSCNDEILSSDIGRPLLKDDKITLSESVMATVSEKKMPLNNELFILLGMAIQFTANIGMDVIKTLISDWVKERIKKWSKLKTHAKKEGPVVIVLFNNVKIEFWVVGNQVEVKYISK